MFKVFLFSTLLPSEKGTYWDPYQVLKLAFEKERFEYCGLTDSPEKADLIIVCPSVQYKNPVFPRELFRNGILLKYRKKCVVIGVNDEALIAHKGFYSSLSSTKNKSALLKGGVYTHVVNAEPHDAFPLDINFNYVFSFMGSFDNHPVRRELGALSDRFRKDCFPEENKCSFLIQDTSRLQEKIKASGCDQRAYKQSYLDVLKTSKFILCPRGGCPSSVRIFETMKAGRVPVIISDDWVPPPEIPWQLFCVFVKERDVAQIPRILRTEESTFFEKARAARQAWDDYLAAEVLPITITRWGISLIETSQNSRHYGHLWQLAKQLLTWRFIRRGVVSELHGLLKGR